MPLLRSFSCLKPCSSNSIALGIKSKASTPWSLVILSPLRCLHTSPCASSQASLLALALAVSSASSYACLCPAGPPLLHTCHPPCPHRPREAAPAHPVCLSLFSILLLLDVFTLVPLDPVLWSVQICFVLPGFDFRACIPFQL